MTRALFLCVAAGAIAAPAFGQAPAGSCRPVFDAMLKETITPHHAATSKDGSAWTESIATADAMYVKVNGAWKKSPMSPNAMRQQQEENIRDATVQSCRGLPDDVVDGQPAAVYQAHFEQKDMGASDARIWISKATGLPLRTVSSMQAGTKMNVSTTYDYAHITAPPVK